jgi:hypothetical protein
MGGELEERRRRLEHGQSASATNEDKLHLHDGGIKPEKLHTISSATHDTPRVEKFFYSRANREGRGE